MTLEERFQAVAAHLADRLPGVEQGRIMRSEGVKTGDRFFAFARDGELVVKLPAERVRELLDGGAGQPFRSGRRVMREWVTLTPPDEPTMTAYVTEAHEFVAGLNAAPR